MAMRTDPYLTFIFCPPNWYMPCDLGLLAPKVPETVFHLSKPRILIALTLTPSSVTIGMGGRLLKGRMDGYIGDAAVARCTSSGHRISQHLLE